MGKVVITGGAGFVGYRLGCYILKNCESMGTVVLFDTRRPQGPLPSGLETVVGDITSASDVAAALKGATVVFHLASYGMSGPEAMDEAKIQRVNVVGTQNIIDECRRQGVGRLVYVSSYNAIFDGSSPIVAGTEATTSYVTRATCSDPYSLTKATAEQAVLAADSPTAAPGRAKGSVPALRTCALRPAGIWGPGEQRHTPRIIRMARQGYLKFVFGDASSLVDFVHVDNLVAACVLAAQALEGDGRAGGKAYFINDDNPVNNFEFFQHIMEGLGYSFPKRRVPFWVVYLLALVMEAVARTLHNITGRIMLVPLLTRTEVAKCAITHYARCDLAREELGYSPLRHGYEPTVAWYKARHYQYFPESPEVRAVRLVRTVRLCMATLMVSLILVSWHNTTRKKQALLDAAMLAQGAVEGTGITSSSVLVKDHGGEL